MNTILILIAFALGVAVGRFAEQNRGWRYDVWSRQEGWVFKWRHNNQEGSTDG